jgi:hypothetical protein
VGCGKSHKYTKHTEVLQNKVPSIFYKTVKSEKVQVKPISFLTSALDGGGLSVPSRMGN